MLNLVCPDCKQRLKCNKKGLYCYNCKTKFGVYDNIPLLLPKKISDFKQQEKEFYQHELNAGEFSFDYVEKEYAQDKFGLLKHFEILQGISKNAAILELGAGNGQYGLILKRRGFKNVVITDIVYTGLVKARDYAKTN